MKIPYSNSFFLFFSLAPLQNLPVSQENIPFIPPQRRLFFLSNPAGKFNYLLMILKISGSCLKRHFFIVQRENFFLEIYQNCFFGTINFKAFIKIYLDFFSKPILLQRGKKSFEKMSFEKLFQSHSI